MSKVLVMTDTVACIPEELAKAYNIKVVPAANIIVNGQIYIEGVTLKTEEAYRLIVEDPDRFVTSAISPDYLLKVYSELAEESKGIFFITISSALSAVSRTATIATELFRERKPEVTIRVWDSKACASTQGLLVLAAAKAAAMGKSLDEVEQLVQRIRSVAGGLMLLDTLRYAYRTGRISKAASQIASLLNIRPINKLTSEGKVEFIDRVRKKAEGLNKIMDMIEREAAGKGLHFMVTHAAVPEQAHSFAEQLKSRFKCLSMVIGEFSPVMGYGAGPGVIFVGFHPEVAL